MLSNEAKIEALNIGFCELVKMLGSRQQFPSNQLAGAMETIARTAKEPPEVDKALTELAGRLRKP